MAKLLTSELATNAITHGQGQDGTIKLEVRSFGCCLGVDVADHSPNTPVLRSVPTGTENGLGLLLVTEIADGWGYYFEGGRKHVWFHLHITDPTRPPQASQVAPAA
jgi:anti-sigma regulatory factor (Ser/Thr protein kinase)